MNVFMDKPDQKIINEIAQQIDAGNECYLNQKTHELICVPNDDLLAMADEDYHREIFKDDFEKIKSQEKDLIKFEVPESFMSFKIMESFKDQIEENEFREKLEQALNRRKPFRNFKFLIDNSSYRQEWFEFKQEELEKIVLKVIDSYNIE